MAHSVRVDRMFLSVMCSSYEEQQLEGGDTRVVLHLPKALAPIKCAILPLVRKDGMPEKAHERMGCVGTIWMPMTCPL